MFLGFCSQLKTIHRISSRPSDFISQVTQPGEIEFDDLFVCLRSGDSAPFFATISTSARAFQECRYLWREKRIECMPVSRSKCFGSSRGQICAGCVRCTRFIQWHTSGAGCIVGCARPALADKRHKTSVSGACAAESGVSAGVMNLLLPKNSIRAAGNAMRIR